ncbi:unnamed protein product, partial [Mesorhabditis belari]|uniref:Protein kinase domain-containing protein n=1 Tax=Mesorhabditis belari TaxID=2138241 RepID=A0AAF3EZV3_9BILA
MEEEKHPRAHLKKSKEDRTFFEFIKYVFLRTGKEREKIQKGVTITTAKYTYEVLELLGPGGFGDVYRSYATKTETDSQHINKQLLRLKLETSVLVECEKAWLLLHSTGYIHRDIKSQNFAIELRLKPRGKTKFIGTVRFASRNCHMNVEQGRKDDLEVWCYMLIDLFDQNLVPCRRKVNKEEVLSLKKSFFHFNKNEQRIAREEGID